MALLCLLAPGLPWTGPVLAAGQQGPSVPSVQAGEDAVAPTAEAAPDRPAASSADEVRQRARRILDSPGYQTEMPDLAELPDLPEMPRFRAWGPLLQVLQIAIVVLGVVLLIYAVVDFFGLRRPRLAAPAPAALPAPPRPAPEPAAPPALPDPEALAAAGRFGDAVHALLLHALVAVARYRRKPLPASWTSREVLRGLDLAAERRGALAELVAAVERYLFAGLPLAADDWERCRLAYRRLAGDGGAS